MTGSYIGTTVYIAEAIPATNDAAGFAALTWVQVKGAQAAPQLGASHSDISVEDLQSGWTGGVKGAAVGNDSTATFREVDGDAGQEKIHTLAITGGDGGSGSIKIVKGTGAEQAPTTGDPVQYAHGYFHTYVETQADTKSHEGFSVNFKQNAATVYALEA